mmetsp:Transcript_40272/g.61459  ORF Transcript_40272/g.61459 Transcript_40272/m.61459 type:complete len:86 (-) Transcript_40272:1152-1409(-)
MSPDVSKHKNSDLAPRLLPEKYSRGANANISLGDLGSNSGIASKKDLSNIQSSQPSQRNQSHLFENIEIETGTGNRAIHPPKIMQ